MNSFPCTKLVQTIPPAQAAAFGGPQATGLWLSIRLRSLGFKLNQS
jgi:hypothetical protein